MPLRLRNNQVLVALVIITVAIFGIANGVVRLLGLVPEERRYVMAVAGVVVLIVNYIIARRMHRAAARVTLDKR